MRIATPLGGAGQRLDEFALRLGDDLLRAELAEVCGTDVEHDTDPRRGDAGQGRDVPGAPRRLLEDEEASGFGGAQRGPGVAEFVVERAGRGDDLTERCEHGGDHVLRGRLARRTGDTDNGEAGAGERVHHGAGELREAGEHGRAGSVAVVFEREGVGLGRRNRRHDDRGHTHRPCGQDRHRTGGDGGRGVIVAVRARTGQRQEQATGTDPSRVELDGTGHLGGRIVDVVQGAPDDLRDPSQCHRDHALPP